MRIPRPGHTDRTWWEALKNNSAVQRNVTTRNVSFIVEKPRAGFSYAFTIEDVCRVLTLVPLADWQGLTTFVFRQPTSKQALLKPSWGRISYYAELFEPGKAPHSPRPVIFLDAVNVSEPTKWNKHLGPADQQELQRLSADGHDVQHAPKSVLVHSSYSAARNTQLYRTLLHEIGHWVDFVNKVERPAGNDDADYSDLADRYWARPHDEREAFAHRYADSLRETLRAAGDIPFERIFDITALEQGGIDPASFGV